MSLRLRTTFLFDLGDQVTWSLRPGHVFEIVWQSTRRSWTSHWQTYGIQVRSINGLGGRGVSSLTYEAFETDLAAAEE